MNHQGKKVNGSIKNPDLQADQDPEQKALQEVSSFLVHKFRNPLGGIKGFAALLERDLSNQPELQKMATMIVKGTDHLNDLFGSILEYCEPLDLNLEETDLFALIKKWTGNPRIHCLIGDEPLPVLADPKHLQSAFSHLIDLAFLSMNEKGTLTITSSLTPKDVIVSFSDEGMGIPLERQPNAFSPFFTAPFGGEEGALSKIKKVIRAHQGSIALESQENKGTTFTITLPIRRG